MPNAGKTCVSTSTDTFWNQKRIEKGVTLKDMADDLGVHLTSLSTWLTGAKLPATPTAIKICDYLGIDYVTGAEEFNKIHEEWISAHSGQTKKRSKIRQRKFCVSDVSKSKPDTSNEIVVPTKTLQELAERSRVQKILYRKISYEEFVDIMSLDLNVDNALKALYGKVDFDAYFALYNELNPS